MLKKHVTLLNTTQFIRNLYGCNKLGPDVE
jgi:hypothetical protein